MLGNQSVEHKETQTNKNSMQLFFLTQKRPQAMKEAPRDQQRYTKETSAKNLGDAKAPQRQKTTKTRWEINTSKAQNQRANRNKQLRQHKSL